MAFFRRRRQRVEWLAGVFDAVDTAVAAGAVRDMIIVAGQDVLDHGFGGDLYVRRVVGTVMVMPTILAAFRSTVVLRKVPIALGVAAPNAIETLLSYEDDDTMFRRDWSSGGVVPQAPSAMDMHAHLVDWKGNRRINEGNHQILLSTFCTVAYQTYVRVRVLVQAPRR